MSQWVTYRRKSTKELFKLRNLGNNWYMSENSGYISASTVAKYYEIARNGRRVEYVETPNGFKVQLTKYNYDNYSHLKRPASNAKKQKPHDQHLGQETNVNQDGPSEGI